MSPQEIKAMLETISKMVETAESLKCKIIGITCSCGVIELKIFPIRHPETGTGETA